MTSNNTIPFPDSDADAELTHQRYMEGVKKALLIGIGTQSRTEDKFIEAFEEVLRNREFWHDPEIYDQVHFIAYDQTFDGSRVRGPKEKAPLRSQFQNAIGLLPLMEAEMKRYYGGATIHEIMGNYYLGTPLSPVDITHNELQGDEGEEF